MNKNIKRLIIASLVLAVGVFVYHRMNQSNPLDRYKPSYTRFISQLNQDKVFKVRIENSTLHVLSKTGEEYLVDSPNDPYLINELLKHNVDVVVIPPAQRNVFLEILLNSIPFLLLIGVWIWFARKQSGGKFGSGGSKAKLLEKDENNIISFSDVAGCDEAKEELREVIEFLQNPERFNKLGGKVPKGVLLTGDPGTGKTLLSRAVAHEAGVPFYYCSGSDMIEMYVGVGSARIRGIFAELRKNESAILFIDEIDALGRSRNNNVSAGSNEHDQTLNALLVEMDGFETNSRIIIIAATNRPDILDKALLRPGRFDRQITVGLPDLKGRKQILEVHTKDVPMDDSVNLENIARGTSGFSGAELANIVNEASIFASREGAEKVSPIHFEKSKDKILMGVERKTFTMNEDEKFLTAIHESAHAVVGYYSELHDPLYKVSIVPRGRALGITMFLPENDSVSISKKKLEGQIASLYAGRIGEEIYSGHDYVTTGASNDIERATLIATKMVTEYGMGKNLIPMVYVEKDGFTGENKLKSGFDTTLVQKEIDDILRRNYKFAEKILKSNWKKVEAMAKLLMEYETIDKDQIEIIMAQ